MESRLERTVQGWTEQWRSEGLELGRSEGLELGRSEGLELGRSEGRRQGEAAALLRLLERRFGEVARSTRRRVEAADVATIEPWLDRLLTARTIDEVFAQEPPKR